MTPGVARSSTPRGEDFLTRMVREVRRELSEGFYERRPAEPPRPKPLPFSSQVGRSPALAAASQVPALQVMVELKHASPGYGTDPLPALPPGRFVEVAEAAGAAALSVIPQPYEFRGSLEELGEVARRSHLPVLFKDFIVDRQQIRAARAWGASAVLLLVRLGTSGAVNAPLGELIQNAHHEGLEVLLEVHGEEEVQAALESRAEVLGVNARDLAQLSLDPSGALPVLKALGRDPRPLVGMSGIGSPAEALAYFRSGASAVLVGTAFSRAGDPLSFLRSIRSAPTGGGGSR